MMPSWLFGSQTPTWHTCAAQFARQGVMLPEWPECLAGPFRMKLQADGPGCFATPGWGRRRSWTGRIDHWVQNPEVPRAWLGLYLQEGETMAEVVTVTPRLGLFMRHRLPEPLCETASLQGLQDACELAGRLLAESEQMAAQDRWPFGTRLMLVDDGLDLTRWGWLQDASLLEEEPSPPVRVMRASHFAYLEVLSALGQLAQPMPTA